MIRQPRKTVQQDQAELRMGQWTAFVNSIWKEIRRPQKYTIRLEKSKCLGVKKTTQIPDLIWFAQFPYKPFIFVNVMSIWIIYFHLNLTEPSSK